MLHRLCRPLREGWRIQRGERREGLRRCENMEQQAVEEGESVFAEQRVTAIECVEGSRKRGERVEREGVVLPEELLEEQGAALAFLNTAGIERICPLLEF